MTGFMSTNVGVDTGGDPFEVVFRPARPTLDVVVQMRTPLSWLRRQKRPPLDVKRASQHRMEAIKRCELIPMDSDLYRAGRLFEQAEAEPAPELWIHLVLGIWLDSRPAAANIREAFRYGIVDSMFHDPEVWEDYLPGFSAPVIAQAIRADRRQDTGAPPSAGGFLVLCAKHRDQFRRWRADINDLLGIRQNAEDILIALGDERLADLGTGDVELESKDLDMELLLLEAPKRGLQAHDSGIPF
jgi:hypothetical protein